MISSKHFLNHTCMKLRRNLWPFFFTNCFSSNILGGCLVWRFSASLWRSGLDTDTPKVRFSFTEAILCWIYWDHWGHRCVTWLLLSSSCWKGTFTLSCRIFWWTYEYIFPLVMASGPGSETVKHAQIMILPPLCFTVGMMLWCGLTFTTSSDVFKSLAVTSVTYSLRHWRFWTVSVESSCTGTHRMSSHSTKLSVY